MGRTPARVSLAIGLGIFVPSYLWILILFAEMRLPLGSLFGLWLSFSADTMNRIVTDSASMGNLSILRRAYFLNFPSLLGFTLSGTSLVILIRTRIRARAVTILLVTIIFAGLLDAATTAVVLVVTRDGPGIAEWMAVSVSTSYALRFGILGVLMGWLVAQALSRTRRPS